MFRELKQNLTILLTVTLVTGVAYPLGMVVISKTLFPEQAMGSLVLNDKGEAVGSSLIGQSFTSDHYFHGRPSAAGTGYDAMASSGSNTAASDKALFSAISDRVTALKETGHMGAIPVDLVTTSASGLDPDISVAAAKYQAARIALARNVPLPQIEKLIESQIIQPNLGFLGVPRINLLRLNMALDKTLPAIGTP